MNNVNNLNHGLNNSSVGGSSATASCSNAAAAAARGGAAAGSMPPAEFVYRLEADVKRLKEDLQCSRQTEADLRAQIADMSNGDRSLKSELTQIQSDNDALQTKLHNLVTSRQVIEWPLGPCSFL